MLVFYMTPGSCSTGIHILLEELELVFGVTIVDLLKGDNAKAGFIVKNPKGTVPVLEFENGETLKDFTSIAWWLASTYPKAELMPKDTLQQSQLLGWLNYIVGTVHGQGFTRIFTPDVYLFREQDKECLERQGKNIISKAFSIISVELEKTNKYFYKQFSILDAALFYVEFWANKIHLDMPSACRNHLELMQTRPAVRRVLAEEGYRI